MRRTFITADADTTHELEAFRNHWWVMLLIGAVLVIAGVLAMAYPFASTVGVVILLASMLVICGVVTIVAAFWLGEWSGFLLLLLFGIFYIVLGVCIGDSPIMTSAVLTFAIAMFAMVGGIFRALTALIYQFPMWGWSLANGVVVAIFGFIVFRHFPEASLLVLGLLLGVDMFMSGLFWIFLSMEIKQMRIGVNEALMD